MLRTWKFAVVTRQGIYQGELIGEQEPGETDAHALADAAKVARQYIESYQPGAAILACFVSDSALHIDAPDTTLININVTAEIHVERDSSSEIIRPGNPLQEYLDEEKRRLNIARDNGEE